MPTYVIQDSVFCFYGRTIGIKLLFFLILRKQNISGLVSKRIREVFPPKKNIMKNNREVNTTSMPLSLNYTMIAKGELGGTLAP